MYATCLFCNGSLGANESIERFPVGKRLAFDAAKGRLWVVCEKCERWNLSPIEERWEAIEEAERAYRDTKKRVSTDNIGLARLRDGTDLIRIGAPLRPEFAAWRYGDQFGKRWKRRVIIAGSAAAVGTAGALAAGGIFALSAGIFGFGMGTFFSQNSHAVVLRDDDRNFHRLYGPQMRWTTIQTAIFEKDLAVQFEPSPPSRLPDWMQRVANGFGPAMPTMEDAVTVTGANAMIALSTILPALNAAGATRRGLSDALRLIDNVPSATTLLLNSRREASRHNSPFMMEDGITMRALYVPAPVRLALEMTLHEEDERRALEGELQELERRWKDAEDIAAIADSLTLPQHASSRIDEIRNKKSRA